MAFLREQALELLQRSQAQGRLAHAYLITGPKGTGKRKLATQIAALANGRNTETESGDNPDIHFVEPESKSRRILIEQTRDLERELQMRSLLGGVKTGIIVDADRLQPNAANAFLKTLEEPPGHSLVILTTEQPEALLDTIISRCIEIPLKSSERLSLTDAQHRLASAVATFFKEKKRSLSGVFLLVRRFASLLTEAKQAIADEFERDFKAEETRYKQTTESRKWLEDREEYYKALTEARYMGERSALLTVLVQWWADVARQQSGAPDLDLPEFIEATGDLAEELSTAEVVRRLQHLETLRENLNKTGVQEQLAIEVAFLNAFGA